jgi:hypothetical protein
VDLQDAVVIGARRPGLAKFRFAVVLVQSAAPHREWQALRQRDVSRREDGRYVAQIGEQA